ncbi:MAG: hypothetical protein QOI64_2353 [Solirubrobacteraceae bacterium]|nr:hypothetical protein [Solirubrobacteraceae bacterium]
MSRGSGRRSRGAAAALLVAGAAALGVSTGFHGHTTIRPAGPDLPVNPGARNPADISANNSPALAQNPRRPAELAIANRIDSPDYSCALRVSHDHGVHWSSVKVPIPRGEGHKCYAPDVAFGADGTLHMSFVTLRGNGNEPHAAWLATSRDGGRTLSAPSRALGPLAFQVSLAADPKRPGRLYLSWLQPAQVGLYLFSGTGNRIQVVRSDDGGRTWSRPVRASDAARERVLAPTAAVAADGSIYVLYLDVGDDRLDYEAAHGARGGAPYAGRFTLVLGRSDDGGRTWQESVVDNRVVPTRRFLAFLPPTPSLAIDDADGRIYAAFEDGGAGRADVHLWSLARGARSWTGPTKVNDTPRRDRTSQYLPQLAVEPGGRLDIAYYDRRADAGDRFNAVSLQSSTDGGRTFTGHVTLSGRRFDSRIGAGSENGLPDLGSRLGVVSEPAGVLAAWADTRGGTVGSNKQDIAFARAGVARSSGLASGLRAALRYGGIALLLGGLALLVARMRPRSA